MSKPSSSLLSRLLSTAVMLPTVLFPLFLGGWWFFGLIVVAMSVATCEYVQMLRRHGYEAHNVFALALLWAILLDFFLANVSCLQPALAFLLFVSLAWHVLRDETRTKVENWLLPLGGALYIGWMAGHMFLIRALPQGGYLLFLTLGATWLADSAAYFVGRAWGKHRMSPGISPKKTWEGFAGGVVVAVAGGAIIARLGGFGWGHGAALGLLLAVLTPIGDLGVSMIKRQTGVKDSSRLIPGHGGLFDRVDSLLVAAIVGYYYIIWVMR